MNPVSISLPQTQPPVRPILPGAEPARPGYAPFADFLIDSFKEVNQLQNTADTSVHDLLTGKDVDRIEVLTSVQKADMSFRLMQQIRNKLVDAYREINQMQI
ncbi:MAG: flagellar hook-basal body complex protein FliE [Pirellulaceae bacterium]